MSVSDKDTGYKKLMRELLALQNISLSVGIHGDVKDYENGASTAAIAAANEFGTKYIPERSFLRSTIDENRQKYFNLTEDVIDNAIDGKGTIYSGMEMIGVTLKGDVQEKITEIKTPANSEFTRKMKELKNGTANPLIDTGHMRSSINYKVTV